MGFAEHLAPERVIELTSSDRDGAFCELVECVVTTHGGLDRDRLLEEIHKRENQISTRIASSIAIPHARVADIRGVIIAVGRSRPGITYDLISDDKVRLVVMILGDNGTHLEVLSEIVSRLANRELFRRIIEAESTGEIHRLLTGGKPAAPAVPEAEPTPAEGPLSKAVFEHALSLARRIDARVLMLHVGASGLPSYVPVAVDGPQLVVVEHEEPNATHEDYPGRAVIRIPFGDLSRSSLVELSTLFGIAGGVLREGERVVNVIGSTEDGAWDSVMVSDGGAWFRRFLSVDFLAEGDAVEERVLAKALQIAGRLAQEGREGKPVGTVFVLGDCDSVLRHCQQLVANPFRGYAEEERNILDPSLEETVKEYSKIDGAFVIRGDGVILSAGTYIKPANVSVQLPKGFGSRHMAAASITAVTGAMAIALSESTRKLSLFRNGRQMILE